MNSQSVTLNALLLTHKRGLGLLLYSEKKSNTNFPQDVAQWMQNQMINPGEEKKEDWKDGIIWTTLVPEGTAEFLSQAVVKGTQICNFSPTEIRKWFLWLGPGSFTGLRCGCAFVEGYLKGNPQCEVFGFTGTLGEEPPRWDLPVNWSDMQNAAKTAMCSENVNKIQHIIPAYGRDPSPVLKLRGSEK